MTLALVHDANVEGRAPPADATAEASVLSAVLLDPAGEVLRPALIWCDQRTDAQCRALTEQIGAERLIALVSNPALTNFTLTKMLWVREREPEVWERVRTVLLPKDYVRLRLTGERATDVADASGTLLFDVARRRWSREMLDAVGMDETLLPEAFESPTAYGVMGMRERARHLGGQIAISSEVGHGSAFTLVLPLGDG